MRGRGDASLANLSFFKKTETGAVRHQTSPKMKRGAKGATKDDIRSFFAPKAATAKRAAVPAKGTRLRSNKVVAPDSDEDEIVRCAAPRRAPP